MRQLRLTISGFLIASIALLIAACGGSSGPQVTQAPPSGTGNGPATYSGPAPASDDVQRFKLNVWDELVATNRCGQCHSTGGQVPSFVRADDINLAYRDTNTVVDLGNPPMSTMVTKVRGGHNCWLTSDAACADVITRLITNWAGDAQGDVKQIQLIAPTLRDPGDAKSFPVSSDGFRTTVYPLLTQYCTNCHAEGSSTPQSPFFASPDVDAAYQAARTKIDLDEPEDSRFVVRLRSEFHNCWDVCANNANTMEAAITQFSAGILPTQIDPALVLSKALTIGDGIVASGGSRYDANAIALWEFKTGSGSIAFDTSGVSPGVDLTFAGDVTWVGGWGIRIANGGRAQGSTTASAKLHRLITGTGEYSIEAWVAPANVVQEDARIVTYSGGNNARNFTLGQTLYNYDFLARASTTNANGNPALSTADADERLQATLQHVVVTYHPSEGRRIYVNGTYTDDADSIAGGTLNDWDDSFAFVLGNETSGMRPWSGVVRFAAVHNRSLTAEQVQRNFDAGVGERFYLLFSIGHLIDTADSYILFEVAQFDSYAYVFSKPRLVVLGSNPTLTSDVPISGVRIGINGREADIGQAYSRIDTTLLRSAYTPEGVNLSDIGTVIAIDKGPDSDEFFLTFERIGNNTHARTDNVQPLPPPSVDTDPQADIGVRTFAEINATMSAVTTVPATQADVRDTYTTVVQQLPSVERIDGFLASHQMGITQLAIEYCNALVETPALASAYFPSLNLSAPASTALAPGNRGNLINPLVNRMVGTGLATQPDAADITAELNSLIDRLTVCGNACAADRTRTVAKASCAAVLGSAAMLLQ